MRSRRTLTDEMAKELGRTHACSDTVAWRVSALLAEYYQSTAAEDAALERAKENVERALTPEDLFQAYSRVIQEAPGGYVAPGLQDPDDAAEQAVRDRMARREP